MVQADVYSTKGDLFFDVQSDGIPELTLNSLGLGVGILPAANLHVAGSSQMNQCSIGGLWGFGGSNLALSGSMGLNSVTLSSNGNLDQYSMVFADTSLGDLFLNLPYAGNVTGRQVNIKKKSSSGNVNILGPVDGFSTLQLSSGNMGSVSVIAGANLWYITHLKGMGNTISSSNLELWLDASNSSSITYGMSGNVLQWNDLSGKNHHFIQTDSLLQPTHSSIGFNNGHAGLHFSGNQYLENLSKTNFNFIHQLTGSTIFLVANYEIDTNITKVILDNGGMSTSRKGFCLKFVYNDIYIGVTTGSNYSLGANSNNEAIINFPILFATDMQYGRSGDDLNMQVNQSAEVTNESTMAPSYADATNNFRLGRSVFDTSGHVGYISEVMIYNKVLSALEKLEVQRYLGKKYRISTP